MIKKKVSKVVILFTRSWILTVSWVWIIASGTLHFGFNLISSWCTFSSYIRTAPFERVAFGCALTIPGIEDNTYKKSIPNVADSHYLFMRFYVLEWGVAGIDTYIASEFSCWCCGSDTPAPYVVGGGLLPTLGVATAARQAWCLSALQTARSCRGSAFAVCHAIRPSITYTIRHASWDL